MNGLCVESCVALSDRECIERCRNGRRDDYRLLVERYEAPLIALLRARFGRHSTEDVAQEAFVRAFQRLDRKRADEPFFPWLAGIALRVAREQHRADRRAQRGLSLETCAEPAADGAAHVESDDRLLRAISVLAHPYRDVVLLRYFAGWSCAEVAECLNVPLGTVTKRLSRAHAILREHLTRGARRSLEVQR